jgi:hypothetical protein
MIRDLICRSFDAMKTRHDTTRHDTRHSVDDSRALVDNLNDPYALTIQRLDQLQLVIHDCNYQPVEPTIRATSDK